MRLIDADEAYKVLTDYYHTRTPIQQLALKEALARVPTIEAEPVVKCKDCRWFDKTEDSSYGYCHAMKHGYYSEHWEISIYRRYKEDFYCADGEKMNAEEEPYEAN